MPIDVIGPLNKGMKRLTLGVKMSKFKVTRGRR